MKGLTEGRIVHFVLDKGPNSGEHRPAVVVNAFRDQHGFTPEDGRCNLQVFTDSGEGKYNDNLPPLVWETSILYSEEKEPGTWHWIEQA